MSLVSRRDGRGEPLVLVHGVGSTWRDWGPALPFLSQAFETIALTLPGHLGGPPVAPSARTGVDDMVDAVVAEIDGLGFGRPHVAGTSLGGWIALELAARGRAASVVAVAPVGMATSAERRVLRRRILRNHRLARVIQPIVPLVARSAMVARLVVGGVQVRGRVDPVEGARKLEALARCPVLVGLVEDFCSRSAGRLTGIDCPVGLAWGALDDLVPPSHAARFLEVLPGAEVEIVEDAGHLPIWDDPGRLAAFIGRVAARSRIGHAGGS